MVPKWEIRSTIEIKVYKEKTTGKIAPKRYKRVVILNGEEYYRDEMPLKMFCAASDPISNLDKFLLGIKERKKPREKRIKILADYFLTPFRSINKKSIKKDQKQ